MCVKIICVDHEHEFNPNEPLEQQIVGAKEILIDYDPGDSRIKTFALQLERLYKEGTNCEADIKVNTNNVLCGIVLERQLDNIKNDMFKNEIIKAFTKWHSSVDKQLHELSEMCGEKK